LSRQRRGERAHRVTASRYMIRGVSRLQQDLHERDPQMRPTTCPSEQQLQAFQLGDLPEPSLNEVAEHLEVCSKCETLARQLDTTMDPILAALRGRSINLEATVTRALGPRSPA